jgi:NADPH-dependent 2,4-dienoyl-CoA reductase/sulfur reductase-like enzyme/nitrite reductase/ring-hydroxylating ferredoxin subunit
MAESTPPTGPDFTQGVRAADIPREGPLAGRIGDEPVLLSRIEGRLYAVGGACTHYGAALADGLADGREVRCPLHHACFDLRTGEALRAPAFAPLDRWEVEQAGALVFIRHRIGAGTGDKLSPEQLDGQPGQGAAEPASSASPLRGDGVGSILILGGGAAGFACAERLRVLGYDGRLVMVSGDPDPPVDRPTLSKDYLAGTAPEEWIPLRDETWYRDHEIDLRLGTDIVALDAKGRTATSRAGETLAFDRLLITTGAEPMRLSRFHQDKVHTLRSLADARALIARAQSGARVAILGASFIGLEAAAALRTRGLEVAVVAPEEVPFEAVFGREVGAFFQRLHEAEGVQFHLGRVGVAYDGATLRLDDGHEVAADFVLAGIGVRPRDQLAADAGLEVGHGILVDRFLETRAPGIFAAGDVASYPDPLNGERIRVEHWVHAERQGQAAAANLLGAGKPFTAVPFFWTEQYGRSLRYVGRARDWDEIRLDGAIFQGAFTARYYSAGQLRASASLGRDHAALEDERELERMIAAVESPKPAAAQIEA